MVRRLPAAGTLSPMYFLFAASQRVSTLLAEALAGAPLDAAGYALYSAVRETQPTSPTDLARHLGMPTTTLLDAVAAMRRLGHVVTVRNPRDGRSYLIRLSETGEQVHDQTQVLFSEADRRLMTHLGDRRRSVIQALTDLKEASDAAVSDLEVDRADRAG